MEQPGRLSETQRRDEEQDNLVGGPGPGQGSGGGNGAAGSVVSEQFSGGGQDNNGTSVQGNSLANVGTSRNVRFSQGVDTSVDQGVRMPSGRGDHTSPGRGWGRGSNRDREHAHHTRQFPSPQRNDQFFSPANFQGHSLPSRGSSYQQEAGGERDYRQLTAFNAQPRASWGPLGPPPQQQQGWALPQQQRGWTPQQSQQPQQHGWAAEGRGRVRWGEGAGDPRQQQQQWHAAAAAAVRSTATAAAAVRFTATAAQGGD